MQPVDTESVKAKIEQDSYFTESRAWYSIIYHFPLAERSFFIVIIILGFLTAYINYEAFDSIFPIVPRAPFVMFSNDIMEDIPHMQRLRRDPDEDRNYAIMRYFLTSYVERRESYAYDKTLLERNFANILHQSSEAVAADFQAWYNARNPSSPFNLYGLQTVRKITVNSVRIGKDHATASFTERLTGGTVSQTRQWVAEIGFDYTPYTVTQDIEELSMTNFFGIALDVYFNPEKYNHQKRFDITPMTFKVTSYTANPNITE